MENAINSNLLNVLEAWNWSQGMHSQALLNFSRVPFAKSLSKIPFPALTDFTDRMQTYFSVDEAFHFHDMVAEISRKLSLESHPVTTGTPRQMKGAGFPAGY